MTIPRKNKICLASAITLTVGLTLPVANFAQAPFSQKSGSHRHGFAKRATKAVSQIPRALRTRPVKRVGSVCFGTNNTPKQRQIESLQAKQTGINRVLHPAIHDELRQLPRSGQVIKNPHQSVFGSSAFGPTSTPNEPEPKVNPVASQSKVSEQATHPVIIKSPFVDQVEKSTVIPMEIVPAHVDSQSNQDSDSIFQSTIIQNPFNDPIELNSSFGSTENDEFIRAMMSNEGMEVTKPNIPNDETILEMATVDDDESVYLDEPESE